MSEPITPPSSGHPNTKDKTGTPSFITTSKQASRAVWNQSFNDAMEASWNQTNTDNLESHESKFALTLVAIGIGLIIVIAGITLGWPTPKPAAPTHCLNLEAQSDLKVVPDAPPSPIPITAVTPVGGEKNGWNHPEWAGLAIDGKPETSWRTAPMRNATPENGGGFGLMLSLGQEPVKVRKVVVNSSATGGALQLRQSTPEDPAGGTLLGTQPLNSTVIFKLDQPVETNHLTLWSTQLPVAAGGGYRLIISEIQVLG